MPTPNENLVIANLPLWKFFAIGLFGSVFFAIISNIALNYTRAAYNLNFSEYTTVIIGWVLFLPFYLLVMVPLWKCAYNTNYGFLGHLDRLYAVLTPGLFRGNLHHHDLFRINSSVPSKFWGESVPADY